MEKARADLTPFWEVYGLKSDPFAVQPITVSEGVVPKGSFVGRQKELARLTRLFANTGAGSRVVVTGPIGVGKTSFVNRARADALENGYFSPFIEIRVSARWNEQDFIFETLAAIYYSLYTNTARKAGTDKIIKRLKPLVEQTVETERGFSVSVMGTGGGYQPAPKSFTGNRSLTQLYALFEETVQGLLKSGYAQVIIHYNNFEEFEDNEEELVALVQRLRDFFQTPNVHFVFVAAKPIIPFLLKPKKFSEILSDAPIELKPLSKDETKEVIRARFEHLAVPNRKSINPVTDETLSTLFDLYDGSLRGVLNSLSTAIREVTNDRPVLLTDDISRGILYQKAEQRAKNLAPKAREVLLAVLDKKEVTNSDLGAALAIRTPNMSGYLRELQNENAIELNRVDGRYRYFAATGWAKWLKLKPAGTAAKQTLLEP